MKGKLIVIDGLDGSGKSTQAQRVYEALQKQGKQVRLISYPDYQKPSSVLVQMYLKGEFSSDPNAVNAYAASTFYAVDRYASFMQDWKEAYADGEIILASRYVTSNAIHQMGKLPKEEWSSYLDWLSVFEYQKLGLPKPDLILFLDMPRKAADAMLLTRYQGDQGKLDIHEKNKLYLKRCEEAATFAAQYENWTVLSCGEGDTPYPMEDITTRIMDCVMQCLK